jgi:hypothetical protein
MGTCQAGAAVGVARPGGPEPDPRAHPERPWKIPVCHQGRTLLVEEDEVLGHLGHGDPLGPCP